MTGFGHKPPFDPHLNPSFQRRILGVLKSVRRRLKRIIVTFVCVVSCYFGILPLFWPYPKTTAELPREYPYDEDLTIRLDLFAWHKNVKIRQVRFYVDHHQTTAHGPEGPFYATSLFHSGKQTHRWPFFTVNRFTWPHSRKLDLTLPFKRLVQEGVVRTGVVVGKLDISIATPSLPGNLAIWLGYITRERTQHIPFTLHLVGEGPADGNVISTRVAGDLANNGKEDKSYGSAAERQSVNPVQTVTL